jgi:hypothetical protein
MWVAVNGDSQARHDLEPSVPDRRAPICGRDAVQSEFPWKINVRALH